MAMQQPYSISQAIGLAKLIEAKIENSKPEPNRQFSHTTLHPPSSQSTTQFSVPRRNTLGLCYKCDKK